MQHFTRQKFSLYSSEQLNSWLNDLGFHLSKPATLAAQILKLSDIYTSGKGSPYIWQDKGFIAAYLAYFQPLNFLRLQQTIIDGEKVGFWQGLRQAIDYGAGLGTFASALAALAEQVKDLRKVVSVEPSPEANYWQGHMRKLQPSTPWPIENAPMNAHLNLVPPTAIGFSYSLNEMPNLPPLAEKAEALFFVEPSTLTAGRRLQELRGHLLEKGFYAWAPCLHQLACPLLKHSPRDWCHTRIHIEMPEWFLEIERHLPMKNSSITYSYLLMRKTPPPTYSANAFRLIGDTLFEKGKVRQAVCQTDKRQFLSWLTKHGEAPTLPRGARVQVQSALHEKSGELRSENGEFTYTIL